MPRSTRLSIALAVLLCAAGAGFYVASALAPERLHREVVGWLEGATRADAEIASLRLVMGFPIRLEGTGLRLWDGALTVEKASARMDVVSLLLGRPRLTRLRLDGAHLQASRSLRGGGAVWEPPIFKEGDAGRPEPALAPLRSIEGAIRFLLTKPLLADTLVVRRSRLTLIHPPPDGSGGPPVRVVFEGVNGRLLHSRLFGDARLFLRARLARDGEERGRLEWTGTRNDEGVMEVAMAATALDLSTFTTYVRAARPGASLGGLLDGVAEFVTAEPGVGQLHLDLGVLDLESDFDEGDDEPLRLPSATLRVGVELDHERVVLSDARIGAGHLDFGLDASIGRPISDASRADVRLSLADLALDPETGRKLAGWLPASARAQLVSVAERLRSGRLVRAELRGAGSLERWGQLLSGSLAQLPAGMRFGIELEDAAIDVDEANRLSQLNASMSFGDDTLDIARASADLNGGPLPELQVRFQGLSKLLASAPQASEMTSTAEALVGLTPLFDFLSGDPEEEEVAAPRPSITLAFDHLRHPALLWPMHDVQVELTLAAHDEGLRFDVAKSFWGGVRLDGWVDWTFQPERRVVADLVATEPTSPAGSEAVATRGAAAPYSGPEAEDGGDVTWVDGRFEVGSFESPGWHQSGARGRFAASGGALRLEDVEIELLPSGRLSGWVDLDLTDVASVPYEAHLALAGADLETLVAQRGAEKRFVTGTLDATARLRGSIIPGRPLLHDANGDAEIVASRGSILRSVPPVFALALASSSLNPFSSREELRYQRGAAQFVLEKGHLSTSGLDIEGPDIRLYASGGLDLARSPHPVEAEVVLFLFRQVDRALELIPILNVLLLGENENLVAAYFELVGTWEEPVAKAKPLRTLQEGPVDVLTKGIPRVMMRGMRAIGGLLRGGAPEDDAPQEDAVDAKPPAATP